MGEGVSWLKRLMGPMKRRGGPEPLGLVAYRTTLGGAPARVHLRGEPDGTALALINASSALRLSPSGAVMMRMLLDGHTDASILADLDERFAAPKDRMANDLAHLRTTLERLAGAEAGSFPIEDLGDGAGARASALSAPLEAWVEGADAEALVARLDALWDAGVPHVTLLVGPDSAADDVVRGVERAEDLGMICGVRGLGSHLPDGLLRRAADAGLDCVQVPVLSTDAAGHDALLGDGDHAQALRVLQTCAELALCAVAEVALLPDTEEHVEAIAAALRPHGVQALALWALVRPDGTDEPAQALPAPALLQIGSDIEALSESGAAQVLWSPPVLATAAPLREQLLAGPRSSGDAAIRVTSRGLVLPPRGGAPAGTLGADAWASIWSDSSFATLRTALAADHRCARCPDLAQCSTECPLEPSMWARPVPGGAS